MLQPLTDRKKEERTCGFLLISPLISLLKVCHGVHFLYFRFTVWLGFSLYHHSTIHVGTCIGMHLHMYVGMCIIHATR